LADGVRSDNSDQGILGVLSVRLLAAARA